MRTLALAMFAISIGLTWQPAAVAPLPAPARPLGSHDACMGALAAQAADVAAVLLQEQSQEKKTPPGEWCQRPPSQSPKGHECACHKHDCDVDPNDDNNRSAHTDPKCLNFCTVSQCMCERMDCP